MVFTWTAAVDAREYYVEIEQASGTKWKAIERATLGADAWIEQDGNIVWAKPQALGSAGAYRWRVRGVNQGVSGEWSRYAEFTIREMAAPGDSGVTVEAESRMPEFAWQAVSGARMYSIEVERLVKGRWQRYLTQWTGHALEEPVQSWTADENGGVHSGTYRWRVRAWNDEGYGSWSDYAPEFTIDVGTPVGVATLLAPAEGEAVISARPEFEWTAVVRATGYYVKFFRNGKSYTLSQNGKKVKEAWAGTPNVQPETDLPAGAYQWWVRAWNPDGFSADGYSAAGTFTVEQ